jgi:hypothetical protein
MSPNAGYHALLMFAGVFGAAGIWFSVYIWRAYYGPPLPPPTERFAIAKANLQGDVTAVLATVPAISWIIFIAWFW